MSPLLFRCKKQRKQRTERGWTCRVPKWCPVICALQRRQVQFLHPQHGSHDASGFLAVRVGDHFEQGGRNDLPRDAVFVLQSAALLRPLVAAFAQPIPVVIDFGLRLALHHKGNGLGEFEMRATVERSKFLTFEPKAHSSAQ